VTDVSATTKESPDSSRTEPVAGVLHTIVLLLALAGVAYLGYRSIGQRQAGQKPNRIGFYLLTVLWEWLVVGYIYWGVRRRGGSMRKLVGGAWNSGKDVLKDMGVASVFWIVALIILGVTAKLLHTSGFNEAARSIAPQNVLQGLLWVLVSCTAGFCEETIFRGYLQRQFAGWTRNVPAGVAISALLFGAGHIYQGVRPAVLIFIFGLLFGILAEYRRSLRPGMIVHAWQDSIAGLLIRFVHKA
jgi:CAAX protease family protein